MAACNLKFVYMIACSYLLLNADCRKSHCGPKYLCLQVLTLPLQVGGSSKEMLHDISLGGRRGLPPLVWGDAGCMVQQVHLLMQHTVILVM